MTTETNALIRHHQPIAHAFVFDSMAIQDFCPGHGAHVAVAPSVTHFAMDPFEFLAARIIHRIAARSLESGDMTFQASLVVERIVGELFCKGGFEH